MNNFLIVILTIIIILINIYIFYCKINNIEIKESFKNLSETVDKNMNNIENIEMPFIQQLEKLSSGFDVLSKREKATLMADYGFLNSDELMDFNENSKQYELV